MNKYIYLPSFKGEPSLVRVEIERETEHTFRTTTGGGEDTIGRSFYIGKRLLKKNLVYFLTEQEALQWLEKRIQIAIEHRKNRVEEAREYLKNIRERMES